MSNAEQEISHNSFDDKKLEEEEVEGDINNSLVENLDEDLDNLLAEKDIDIEKENEGKSYISEGILAKFDEEMSNFSSDSNLVKIKIIKEPKVNESRIKKKKHNYIISKNEGAYSYIQCHMCNFTCGHGKQKAYERHLYEDHDIRQCRDCGEGSRTFDTFYKYYKHRFLQHGKPVQCSECPLVFQSLNKLRYHFDLTHRISSGIRKYWKKCDHCEFAARYDSGMIRHLFEKHEQTFCGECGKNFSVFSAYQKHCRSHKPLDCQYCSVKFHSKVRLLKHIKMHLENPGEDLYPKKKPPRVACPKCGKGVRTDHMPNHLKWVHGPPKTCSWCGISVKNIERHLQTAQCNVPEDQRTNKETVQCHICSKILKKNSLRDHLKITHGEKKNFACDQCGYTTNINHNLFLHTKRVHEKKPLREPCPQCKQECVNLEWHIATYHTSVF